MIREREVAGRAPVGTWTVWPISWSAILVGALAAVVAVVVFGLIGTAIGATKTGAEGRITSWSGVGFASLAYSVIASFFAFVIGGWLASGEPMRVGNYRVRFEPGPDVTHTSDRTTRI